MPNKKGGKKFKKGKKNIVTERELITKEGSQEYAKVLQVNGNGRFNVFCFDGKNRLGIVAGKLRKKVWINGDDIVLTEPWEFQDEKCSIIHKYDEDEVKKLKNMEEFPSTIQLDEEDDLFDDPSESEDENESNSSESDESDVNLDDI
mgnify:CR=1 FL=1